MESHGKQSQFTQSSPAHVSLWRDGVDLYAAGFHFADERSREWIRAAPNLGAEKARNRALIGDVFGELANGELIALGHLVQPQISNGPVPIPPHFFSIMPVWENVELGEIENWGWKYKDVRIVQNSESIFAPANPNPVKPQTGSKAFGGKRGGGRTSQYPMAKATLDALWCEHESYRGLSALKLLDTFNARYLQMHTPPGGRLAPVAERSLRHYLKRYRRELAGIGEN